MRRDAGQHVAEVGPRIDPMLLAGRHEAVEDRGARAPRVAATEEPVLPAGDHATERPFGHVVIDGQVAVLDIPRERRPLGAGVADRLPDRALREHEVGLLVEPRLDALEDRLRLVLPKRPARVGGEPLGVSLHSVEFPDEAEGQQRAGGVRGLRVPEVPARVRPARALEDAAGGVEAIVARVGIGLQSAAELAQKGEGPRGSPDGYFVLVVLAHERRRVLHFNVTEHPTAAWTAQQIVKAPHAVPTGDEVFD